MLGDNLSKLVIEGGDPSKLDWQQIQERAAKNGTDWKSVEPGCQWRNGLAEAAVKLVKSTLELTLASHTTLTYAELDTVFASVSNIVNQRPIAVRSYTEEDLHAITPNDLLHGRSKNTFLGLCIIRVTQSPKGMALVLRWYIEICLKIDKTIGLSTYAQGDSLQKSILMF